MIAREVSAKNCWLLLAQVQPRDPPMTSLDEETMHLGAKTVGQASAARIVLTCFGSRPQYMERLCSAATDDVDTRMRASRSSPSESR